jgi:hypothetical protein
VSNSFVELTLGNILVWHGYDADNKEVIEEVTGQSPAKKIVAVSRIQSLTEKYVLVSSGFGRFIYWEHHDGYEILKTRLRKAGFFIE